MNYYLCPNCGERIVEEYDFCPNCGEKIIIINNNIYLQTQYDEISDVYISLEEAEKAFTILKNEINNNLDDENFLIQLQDDPEEKKELLNNITTTKNQLNELKNTVTETLNDPDRMNYLESMNNIFGDGKTKIEYSYSLIEDTLSLLDMYEEIVTSNIHINNNKDNDKPIPMNDDRIVDI